MEPQVVQGRVVGKPEDAAWQAQAHQQPALFRAAQSSGGGNPNPPLPQQQYYGGGNGADAGQRHDGVLQMTCKDPTLPPEIRLNFVKKVYGILFCMLVVTFGLTTPFLFLRDDTLHWFRANMWVLYLVSAIMVAQYIFNFCMMCEAVCGGSNLMGCYMTMFKTVPFNYLWLATFSACFGVLVGFIAANYTYESVLLVFGICAVLIVGLTIFAVKTKADFTGCGAYLLVGLLGFLLLILIVSFFPGSNVTSKIIGAAGATLFGFIIVHDTQQIFGSASSAFGGGERKFEYSVDMYAFAAWMLFLDFINFFIFMLQLLGVRRD